MNQDPRGELRGIVRALNKYLQVQRLWGIKEYPHYDNHPSSAKPLLDSHTLIDQLQGEVSGCRRCSLHMNRKNIVFGTGNPQTDLVFVGEAPGEEEDLQGKPFVGLAGNLLTRIIESIGLSRDKVYIANVVKCRPPNNRNPKPEEISACEPFLQRQLEIIKPKLICA